MGNCLWCMLTVTDHSDDAKDNEPEEYISSVAQQQDEDQTDPHSYHQTTATTQTHTYGKLTCS